MMYSATPSNVTHISVSPSSTEANSQQKDLESRHVFEVPSDPASSLQTHLDASEPPSYLQAESGTLTERLKEWLEDGAILQDDQFWTALQSEVATFPKTFDEAKIHQYAPNPFSFRQNLTWLQIAKLSIGTLLLVPIRTVMALICILVCWIISKFALHGMKVEDLASNPLDRRKRRYRWFVYRVLLRSILWCLGFLHISTSGRRATREEAPVLVVGPHSTPFDIVVLILCGGPSPIAQSGLRNMPFFNSLADLAQPIYVDREATDSRAKTARAIRSRVVSEAPWQQLLIFPEGVCTNRRALLKFKVGAFLSRAPVQPVLLRFRNALDTYTWTTEGHTLTQLLWLTSATLFTRVHVEFMPVYVPDEDEVRKPELYAKNVEAVMAEQLQFPKSDMRYQEGPIFRRLLSSNLREKLTRYWRCQQKLRTSEDHNDFALVLWNCCEQELRPSKEISFGVGEEDDSWLQSRLRMDAPKFQQFLFQQFGVNNLEKESRLELFKLLDYDQKGVVDFREYLVISLLFFVCVDTARLILLVFVLFGHNLETGESSSATGFRKRFVHRSTVVGLIRSLCLSKSEAEKIWAGKIQRGKTPGDDWVDIRCFRTLMGRRFEFAKYLALCVRRDCKSGRK